MRARRSQSTLRLDVRRSCPDFARAPSGVRPEHVAGDRGSDHGMKPNTDIFEPETSAEATADEIHRHAVVIDLHSGLSNDVVRRRDSGERAVMSARHLPRIRAGGLDAVCVSVGGDTIFAELFKTDRHLKACLLRLEAMLADLDESPEQMKLALTARDVVESKSAGKTAILLGIEGARPLEDRLELLSLFYRLGVRRLQLTWNFRNAVADGCGEPEAGRLTRFGRDVIREVDRLGMILDLSHISEPSFWSALEVAAGPVVVSHANCGALHAHPRNVSDDQIRALAERGGLIGVCPYAPFLAADRAATLTDVAHHIEHVIELVGPDHVGIGPDYIDHNKGLQMVGAGMSADLYPPDQMSAHAVGMGTFAETGNLTRELVRRGHKAPELEKLLGGNYLRIFREVFGD